MFVCQSLKRKSCFDYRLGQDSAPHSPPPIAIVMVPPGTPGPPWSPLVSLVSSHSHLVSGKWNAASRGAWPGRYLIWAKHVEPGETGGTQADDVLT